MNITTKANIKALIGKDDAADDVILTAIALAVSIRCENYMERLVETAARTEYFDIAEEQRLFLVKAFPVSACQVWNDYDRSWSTELDSSVFTFLGDWGEVIVDQYTLVAGAKRLKITYTGGMAATQSAIETAFPDLEMAARIQGAFLWEKRQKLGIGAESFAGGSMRFQTKLQLIPEVKQILNNFRRQTYA